MAILGNVMAMYVLSNSGNNKITALEIKQLVPMQWPQLSKLSIGKNMIT
jgi:hypothetical protein